MTVRRKSHLGSRGVLVIIAVDQVRFGSLELCADESTDVFLERGHRDATENSQPRFKQIFALERGARRLA